MHPYPFVSIAEESPSGDYARPDRGLFVCDSAAAYRPRNAEESILYEVVAENLETFLSRQSERDHPVPRFVERELRLFLDCGIPAHGFLRVHCDACGEDRIVPFSCKCRGFCPSCGGRRMADTAAHLVDRVLPEVPVRQWVLSLPFALRYRLAYDARLVSEVLRIFVQAVFGLFRSAFRQTDFNESLYVNCRACFAGALRELSRGNRKQGYDELFGKDLSHWKQYEYSVALRPHNVPAFSCKRQREP